MKSIPRMLLLGLLAFTSTVGAQINVNAPAPPRAVLSTDKLLIKLDGDARGYLLPISSLITAALPAFTGDCTTTAGNTAITCTKIGGVVVGGAAFLNVGTGSGTVAAGNDARFTNDRTASGLRNASGIVSIAGATAPVAGQLLIATGPDEAAWQTLTGVGVTDGDKGALTVSGTGTAWALNNGVVTTAKLGGDITSAGKALLDDADNAAQRATLGLSTLATTVPDSLIPAWLATPSSINLRSALLDETGTGPAVFATSPALTTPSLGVASATSVNGLGLTGSGSASIAAYSGSVVEFSNTLAFAGTNGSTLNIATGGTLTGLAFTAPGSGIVTWLGTPSSANLRAALTDETGTGAAVFGTSPTIASPTLTTPTLGVATATSINKLAITAPATSATLTVANGKTLTANNTLSFSGTDSSTLDIGTGGTLGTMAYQASSNYITTSAATTALAGKLGNVETSTSTALSLAAIPDGSYLKRNGATVVGDAAAGVTQITLATLATLPASTYSGRVVQITDLGNVGTVLLISNGTNWVPFGGRQLIWYTAPTSVTQTGATTEAQFTGYDIVMPATLLTTIGSMEFSALVDFDRIAASGTNQARAKISGTIVSSVSNANARSIEVRGRVFNNSSLSAQYVSGVLATAAGVSQDAAATFSINTATTPITVTLHSQSGDTAVVRTLRRFEAWWVDR